MSQAALFGSPWYVRCVHFLFVIIRLWHTVKDRGVASSIR